jgi:hypothetical protein
VLQILEIGNIFSIFLALIPMFTDGGDRSFGELNVIIDHQSIIRKFNRKLRRKLRHNSP